MDVVFDGGIYLPELDLWLDSRRKRASSLISHAHSDHTARHQRPLLTAGTRALLGDYLKKADPVTLEYGEPIETERYSLALYPAGHCLGSSQALVVNKRTGERLLYTGDFKTRSSPINEATTPVPCDTLVIESTYGRPQYVFPPDAQVIAEAAHTLRGWLSQGYRPIVLCWRLGKAQEALYHLLAAGFDVAVEPGAYEAAEAYQEQGVAFPGAFRVFDGTWRDGEVLVCPPGRHRRDGLDAMPGVRLLELTGWAMDGGRGFTGRVDARLPFSDHAGFDDLVGYVRQVQPGRVYTVFGFADLASHLRNMGYAAQHLDGKTPVGAAQPLQMRLM